MQPEEKESQYHKGRLSVIDPLIDFINKEMERQKKLPSKSEHHKASKSGVVKGMLIIRSRLEGLKGRYEQTDETTQR